MFMLRIIFIIILILAAIPFINKAKDYFGDKKDKIAKEINLKDMREGAGNLLHPENKDKKIAQENE